MKLKNALIVVEDVETSVLFYRELFGLQVVSRKEGNVIMTEGTWILLKKSWQTVHLRYVISADGQSMTGESRSYAFTIRTDT